MITQSCSPPTAVARWIKEARPIPLPFSLVLRLLRVPEAKFSSSATLTYLKLLLHHHHHHHRSYGNDRVQRDCARMISALAFDLRDVRFSVELSIGFSKSSPRQSFGPRIFFILLSSATPTALLWFVICRKRWINLPQVRSCVILLYAPIKKELLYSAVLMSSSVDQKFKRDAVWAASFGINLVGGVCLVVRKSKLRNSKREFYRSTWLIFIVCIVFRSFRPCLTLDRSI